MPNTPVIPETVTVHLGRPDASAPNVTVPFSDYVKNVASSEIYPTWPENAIRANVYAITSFALNRIYTEYYRSRGYDFDITNSTGIDQSFVYGRDIFENVSKIVDEIYTDYVRRPGTVEPYFTSYCDGVRVQCGGLSQWGTVALAREGRTPYEILQAYYGKNIEIVRNAPVAPITDSYPGRLLTLGTAGDDVRAVQIRLNRIAKDYPAIPKIDPTDGIFGVETENAVRAFQRIFDLTEDGIAGRATWYAIRRIYAAVKRLNDLYSEGISPSEVENLFAQSLKEGDRGAGVTELQYFLAFLSVFEPSVPSIVPDGIFGPLTKRSLEAFQRLYELPVTGVTDTRTWDVLYRAYRGVRDSLPEGYFGNATEPYPGYVMRIGASGNDVRTLQTYLARLGQSYASLPSLTVDGSFGPATKRAVIAFQKAFGLTPNGIVSARTWNEIASAYRDVADGAMGTAGQYPGYNIGRNA